VVTLLTSIRPHEDQRKNAGFIKTPTHRPAHIPTIAIRAISLHRKKEHESSLRIFIAEGNTSYLMFGATQ
jgi:hypothetical protein